MIDLSNIRGGVKDSVEIINYAVAKLGEVGRLVTLFPERVPPEGAIIPGYAALDPTPAPGLEPEPGPGLIDSLMGDPNGSRLGGEVREVTVLFADIRGFTQIAERLDGDILGLSMATSAILDALSEVVLSHGGTLDKYMGDCLMAFWGAPGVDPIHAQRACAAAAEMLHVVASPEVKAAVALAVGPDTWPAEISIGVNTGRCFVGNHGSRLRFSYSVLGDTVNVASRLQQLCGAYETPILIGESTVRQLGDGSGYREVDRVVLRGRSQPLVVFTPTPTPAALQLQAAA